MDHTAIQQRLTTAFSKYKFVILILCIGVIFMTLPVSGNKEQEIPVESVPEERDMTADLTEILGQIRGVGRVRVMLTESAGALTVYQTDDDMTESEDSSSVRKETVLIRVDGDDRGLVQTVTPPVYLGAIVVCQGGDDPHVRLAVTQAVSAVTGIGTDRITVLKMK